jgi:exopolysaccharide biosynthesis WecB/TagA/CpsF family protein
MSRGEALTTIEKHLTDPTTTSLLIASANLNKLTLFGTGSEHEGFFDLDDRWLVLLDGAPLAAQARRVTGRQWPVLAGSDLLPEILSLADRHQLRVGVLGGSQPAVGRLSTLLSARFPSLVFLGGWTPTPDELAQDRGELASQIRMQRVDLLVVALGGERGEHWLGRHADAAGAQVAVSFGAAVDFMTGAQRRAPAWVRRLGMEWCWRLLSDPRRMAHRYLVEGPRAYATLRRSSRDRSNDS